MCVFGIKDLDTIITSGSSIVNKFRNDFDPYIGQCLAEIVAARAENE